MLYSDDPHTIISYGILAKSIMENTSNAINWKFISKQIQHMLPENYYDYTRYPAGSNEEELNTQMIPELCERFDPEFYLTIGDIQHFRMTRYFIERKMPWIHYLPIDSHDKNSIRMNAYTIHNVDIPVCMSRFARDFCLESGLENCDKFIYPIVKSEYSEREFQMVKNKEPTWESVHLGFRKVKEKEESDLYSLINAFKQELKIPENTTILLFLGRMGWRKNPQFLFSILRKLTKERKRKVILYFHTDVNDPASVINMSKEFYAHDVPEDAIRRTKGYKWYKGIHTSALNAIYNIADIQISTHGGEGFGIPLAEGLAAELPFVATDCTTTPELSGNNKWSLGVKVKHNIPDKGIVRPYVDLEDFCDKIEYLIDNENERAKMGRMGREWVKKTLNPEKISKKWMEVFDLTNVNKITVKKNEYGKAVLK